MTGTCVTPRHWQLFVAGVQALDGGDAPEDVHGGLERALRLDWGVGGSMTRVLVHVADAPCHGTRYHACADSYPGGDPHGLRSDELLLGLKQRGVCYMFGRINSSTDRMIELFDQEAGGGYISACDVADCRAITAAVTATLRTSICHTHASLLSGLRVGDVAPTSGALALSGRGEKTYSIREGLPCWDSIESLPVILYSNKLIENIEQLTRDRTKKVLWILPWGKAIPTDVSEKAGMELKISPDPFAEGHCRLAYHGLLRGKPVVLKVITTACLYTVPHNQSPSLQCLQCL